MPCFMSCFFIILINNNFLKSYLFGGGSVGAEGDHERENLKLTPAEDGILHGA